MTPHPDPARELTDAIAHLYHTLRVPRQIYGHAWLSEDPDLRTFERRLKQTKRHEVTAEDINALFMNNCDSERSLKYYLPRALELIAHGERFINSFYISLKLWQSGFEDWPTAERDAVVRVLSAIKPLAANVAREALLSELAWLLPESL